MKRKAPLNVFEVRWERDEWGIFGPNGVKVLLGNGDKKSAVDAAASLCHGLDYDYGLACSLRIHDKSGKFQSERTYPRSRDPKRSKG